MADANTKAKTASKSTRTRKSAAASEALTQALATAPVQYIPVRPLRGLGKAGTPAAPPLLPLRRLPDFFFLPLLLLF
ncbi:hypothetical protein ACJPR0_004309, partial [Cronobacter sakazakii]